MKLTFGQKLTAMAGSIGIRSEIKQLLLRRYWQRKPRWDQDYLGLKVSFDTRDYFSNTWFYGPKNLTIAHEPGTTRLIAHLAKTANAFVDIGANLGYFTVIAGASQPGLRILALEMDAYLRPLIERNAAINGISNLSIETCAVGDGEGQVSYTPHAYSFLLKLSQEPTGALALAAKAPIAGIDALLSMHAITPDLVKLDIDGAEVGALRSASKMLSNPDLTMLFEIHPDLIAANGEDISEAGQILADQGFRAYEFPEYRSGGPVRFVERANFAELTGYPMLLVTRKDPTTLFADLET